MKQAQQKIKWYTAILKQSGWKIQISKVGYRRTLVMKISLLHMLLDHRHKCKQVHVTAM